MFKYLHTTHVVGRKRFRISHMSDSGDPQIFQKPNSYYFKIIKFEMQKGHTKFYAALGKFWFHFLLLIRLHFHLAYIFIWFQYVLNRFIPKF